MSFDSPRLLLFLLVLAPYVLWTIYRYRRRRGEIKLYALSAGSDDHQMMVRKLCLRMIYADCLFIGFLFFCIIAAAGPRWGRELVPDFSRGVDLVFAIDLSRSMSVRDCPPLPGRSESSSRLETAISIAYDMSLDPDGKRLGAAIGKGRGILALPLSYDPESMLGFLLGADEFLITGTGTNLESLIDAASSAFKDDMPGRRFILVFSDGESLDGIPDAAVARAADRGIVICAAGVGSDDGGTISFNGELLLNQNNVPVISARMSETLKGMAEKTGGIYVDGNNPGAVSHLEEFYRSFSGETGLMGRSWEIRSRSHIFLLAALICLGLSRLYGFTRKKKRIMRRSIPISMFFIFVVGLLPLLTAACSPSSMTGKLQVWQGNYHQKRGYYNEAVSAYLQALEYDNSAPYAEYGLGSSYFALEESAAAMERYLSSEKSLEALPEEQHRELRFRLRYNMGIIYFEQGDYEKAAGLFRNALETDGSRIEAKRNLELSLISINSNRQPLPAPEGQGDEKETMKEQSSQSLVLFDYLRKKEQEIWKSKEWTEEPDSAGPDY